MYQIYIQLNSYLYWQDNLYKTYISNGYWIIKENHSKLVLPENVHMRRFPEPQHFYAAEWQKWDFGPSGKGPRWALINIILVYFENLGLVDLGFEGSKSKK